MADYDRDPDALAWARAKIQRKIDIAKGFADESAKRGRAEQSAMWQRIADHMRRSFIGDGGCVIATFDERLPSLPPVERTET